MVTVFKAMIMANRQRFGETILRQGRHRQNCAP
jgi:hypothetical protein